MFDPYNIYKRQVHSSHSGQVLRKKIRRKSGKVYTKEELEAAIPPLKAIGYSVQKGQFFSTQITTWSDTYMIPTGSLNFTNTSASPFLFEQIWPSIKSDFQDCLRTDPLSVVNILFEIDLLSIDLHNFYSTSGSLVFPNISIYMDDPSLRVFDNPQSGTVPQAFNNFHVGFRSYSSSRIFLTESSTKSDNNFWGYSGFITKKEYLESPYLNIIENRQPEIITALRNDDYDTFNPSLFYIYMSQQAQMPATISDSFITVQVKMIIEHK